MRRPILMTGALVALLALTGFPCQAVEWKVHQPNTRFAVDESGTPGDAADDLVLDKETGLIWTRNANLAGESLTWKDAIAYCRDMVRLGNRKGWRIPTVEELTSLVDLSQRIPALPPGHPFINVQPHYYCWSGANYDSPREFTWYVNFYNGKALLSYPRPNSFFIWPVLPRQ